MTRRSVRRETIANLWNAGRTSDEIADHLNIDPRSVFYTLSVLRKAGDARAYPRRAGRRSKAHPSDRRAITRERHPA